jgi:hypothetical protein
MRRALWLCWLAAGCASAPPVHFNHVFAVLDAETAASLDALPAELAVLERRTTSADHDSWTGFYLYGRETYLELFAPGGSSGSAPGDLGLCVSVERAGGLDRIARRLDSPADRFETDVRVKKSDGRSTPWFRYGGPHSWPEKGPIVMWVSEFLPPFKIDRRGYLAEKFHAERALLDVRAVVLALPPANRDWLAASLTRLGWRVRRDGNDVIADDGQVTLTVQPDEAKRGLVEMVFALSRAVERKVVAVGTRSTLTLGPGAEARWRFEPIATSSAVR